MRFNGKNAVCSNRNAVNSFIDVFTYFPSFSLISLPLLLSELEPHFHDYHPARPPAHLMGWRPEKDTIPDVWIDPRDSVIVEVKCYEITPCKSNNYVAE